MASDPTRAAPQQEEDFFGLVSLFAGYISKPEITALTPNYLVPGSKNVLIDYANRVISRNGYKLYNQKNTGAGAVKGSYEWNTSTGSQFSLRTWDQTLDFDWNGAYNALLSNMPTPYVQFAPVLDYNEQIDVLLGVCGDGYFRRWSGGVSKVRASTATTLQKEGVIGPQTLGICTITNASPAVVTFNAHGFVAGDQVIFTASDQGATGTLPTGITAGQIYFVISTGLMTNSFEFSATNGGAAINTTGAGNGVFVLQKANSAKNTGIAFVSGTPATITDSQSNFLNAGFAAGDTITVVGSPANSRSFTIASVTAGTITLIAPNSLTSEAAGANITLYNQTAPTWKSARFFSYINGRSILYKGVEYTYTGGEFTDTLVGLSSFPTVSLGDAVWQAVNKYALPAGISGTFPNFYPNLIGTQLNMVFVASTLSPMVFASSAADYTNFTLVSTRAQGDPVQQPLNDGPATCIVPMDNDRQILNIQNTLVFGSGIDAFDQIDFHMSADNTEELVRIIRYKTAKGTGLISTNAICPIKEGTAYISREPALDTLSQGQLEAPDGKKNVPISDPIKNDFDSYNFTDAHLIYYKRQILVALPAHGIVLIYDMMRNLWQPPQYMPIGRFAIINDLLYGHSSVTNETYQLFVGTSDNGVFIPMVARFAYNNGGTRDRLKNMSEYWSDGYLTANALVNFNMYYGFAGSRGFKTKTIAGNDSKIVAASPVGIPFGNRGFGKVPFGGASGLTISGLPGAGTPLFRFNQINTYAPNSFFEHFVEYTMNVAGAQFAIVAHGSDQFDGGTSAAGYKK